MIAIVVETTAKVTAERWLKGESERLRMLFEQAPGFFALLRGPHHVFELANPAAFQLIGSRNVLGKPLSEAMPEIARQGFVKILDGVFAGGEPYIGNAVPVSLQRQEQAEPDLHYLDFVFQPFRSPGGNVTGVFVQGTDVTGRVLAANALRESEDRFRLVAESAPVMLWMGDQAGKCLFLNKPQRDFWGC